MLYFRFKPNVPFWIVVVVLRKMCMAFITLLFHSSAAFQLATLLLVLFVCFVIQMRILPYLSPSQYHAVLESYPERVFLLDEELKQCAKAKDRAARRRRQKRDRLGIDDVRTPQGRVKLRDAAVELIFEYNTVEGSLLSASILICLMGVMLDSDYVQNGKHVYAKQALIQAALTTIAVSFLYFLVVVWYEIILAVFPSLRCSCFGLFSDRRANETVHDESDSFDETLEMADINPRFAKEEDESSGESKLMSVQEQIAMKQLVKDLQEENRNLKYKLEQGGSGMARVRQVVHKSKKRDFDQDDIDANVIYSSDLNTAVHAEPRRTHLAGTPNRLAVHPSP